MPSEGRWKKTEIGDRISFVPQCMIDSGGCFIQNKPVELQSRVQGEVVYINWPHRWYRVRYSLQGFDRPQHECFSLPVAPDPTLPYKHGFRHKYPARLPQGEGLHAAGK